MKIGVVGGGQLAQMLAQAATALGLELYVLSETLACPAQHTAKIILGNPAIAHDVARFAAQVDVLTFEFEKLDIGPLAALTLPIYPPLSALQTAQDRALEKFCFIEHAIPTTRFKIVTNQADCLAAVHEIGLPVAIKTCCGGYDGKAQAHLYQLIDLAKVWPHFADKRLIVENLVQFERELSLLAARDRYGEIKYYPLTENFHQQGILRFSKAPYNDIDLQALAENYLKKILVGLNYVGVLAVEFFQCGEHLIANEMASRVHNSGHWTIEGAHTSQFENHLRAISGLPLGATHANGYSAMLNFIGHLPKLESSSSALAHTYFHDYCKIPRAQRKLGHITICVPTAEERDSRLEALQEMLS